MLISGDLFALTVFKGKAVVAGAIPRSGGFSFFFSFIGVGFLIEYIFCSSRLEKIIGNFIDVGKLNVQI